MSGTEIIVAVCTAANLWMHLSIRNEMLKLELRIRDKFLTSDDFARWTRQSPNLPNFEKAGE